MTAASDPQRTVRLAHRGALAVLAGCAVLIAASPSTLPETQTPVSPSPVFPYIAIALGVGAITCRQQASSAARSTRSALVLSILCFSLAASIGVVGVALFWFENLRQIGLLYTVGGAILAMRAPQPIRPGPVHNGGESK